MGVGEILGHVVVGFELVGCSGEPHASGPVLAHFRTVEVPHCVSGEGEHHPPVWCTGEAMGIKLQGVGGGGTGEPIKLQGFAGSHTRPARPPEAKLRRTAGGLHFFGGELR